MVQQLYDSSTLIEYPETDGQPMTESDATRTYMIYCIAALRVYFQSRPRVYVSGNLFIYYEEGTPSQNMSPDVFVVFGVSKRERRSYKTWQEDDKVPSFVLELTSKSTKKQDEETKPLLYRQLGIQEYFQYDPTGDYLKPQLKGQTLVNGTYQSIASQTLADGSITIASQVLGLELKLLPATAPSLRPSSMGPLTRELRFIDPSTGTQLLTYEESERSRLQAEQEVSEARHRIEQAEQQAEEQQQRAEEQQQRAEEQQQRAEEQQQRAEEQQQQAKEQQQQAEEERQRAEEERQRAEEQQQRAEEQQQRAEEQQQRAEEERQRAERLAAHLRSLGIDPDTLT